MAMTETPGAARCGQIDMRAQAEVPSALRTDTPKHRPFSASADVSSALSAFTRNYAGVPDRSAQCNTHADVASAGNAATASSSDFTVSSPTEQALQSCG